MVEIRFIFNFYKIKYFRLSLLLISFIPSSIFFSFHLLVYSARRLQPSDNINQCVSAFMCLQQFRIKLCNWKWKVHQVHSRYVQSTPKRMRGEKVDSNTTTISSTTFGTFVICSRKWNFNLHCDARNWILWELIPNVIWHIHWRVYTICFSLPLACPLKKQYRIFYDLWKST